MGRKKSKSAKAAAAAAAAAAADDAATPQAVLDADVELTTPMEVAATENGNGHAADANAADATAAASEDHGANGGAKKKRSKKKKPAVAVDTAAGMLAAPSLGVGDAGLTPRTARLRGLSPAPYIEKGMETAMAKIDQITGEVQGVMEWFEMLVKPEEKVKAKHDRILLDLDLATQGEIENSIARLQGKLARRVRGLDVHKVVQQMDHIEKELALSAAGENLLSLCHLETYESYLGRLPAKELMESHPKLAKRHSELKKEVHRQQLTHPKRLHERSNDRLHTNLHNAEKKASILRVPHRRRRQMLVIFFLNFFTGPLFVFFCSLLFLYCAPVAFMTVYSLYFAFIVIDNMTRPYFGNGSRLAPWYRDGRIYRYFCEYFPMRMAMADPKHTPGASGDFDPERNYLFGLHPHGVQAASIGSLLSKHAGSHALLPGLTITGQTLKMNFWLPVYREHMIFTGVGDASKAAVKRGLSWKKGASTTLVIGGAKEALYAAPHTNKIALENRMGFVKLAIQCGASLVPVYAFGENSLYDNLVEHRPGLIKWQRRIQKIITFAPLFVAGRGVFSYSGGLIPHRRPITTVVGRPIHLEKEANPSPARIQQVHAMYIDELRNIFETYRDIYDPKCEDMVLV